MRKFLLIPVLLFFLNSAYTQIDTAEFERFKNEYDEYIKKENDSFEKYKEERDKEFEEFLKKDWENFQLFAAGKPIQLPGPEKIPVYDKKQEIKVETKMPAFQIVEIPQNIIPETKTKYRPIPAIETASANQNLTRASINYFGVESDFNYNKDISACIISSINEPHIAYYWSEMIKTDYYNLIEQLLDFKNSQNLNDFAFLKLTEKVSESIHPLSSNNAKLLTWFLLLKSGYKAKIGYSGNDIYLLVPVVNTIYSYSYFVFENMKYYIFEKDKNIGSIYTYKHDYPEANRIMNFNLYKTPSLGSEKLSRELNFNYEDKEYKFNIDYSKNLIDFYDIYPQGEIQIFFNAGISHNAKESLDRNLDSLLSTMDEMESANFLLNFTQKAFDYKTDHEQFGYEKFFFPEEIFHYAYADCEDRSVFYSFLISEYLRLPVAGLNYPGHIATAVKFSENANGYYFIIDNEKYVICDPTYINAPVGACMPEFINSDVNIIRLKNTQVTYSIEDKIWEKMNAKGFQKTNYDNNIVKVAENSWYMTGLVDSIVKPGEIEIPKSTNLEILFIAHVDNDANILSYEVISGDGLLMPIGIAYSDNKIYLSGYYSKTLNLEDQSITSDYDRELFMAAYDLDIKNIWLRSSGISQEEETANIFFAANFDKQGNFLYEEYISEQSFELQKPIDVNSTDKIVIYGKYEPKNPLLIETQIYDKHESYDFAKALNELTLKFISEKYNRHAAGLFALLTILNNGNITIKNSELLSSIIAINPEFQNLYPRLYKDVRDINKIKSKNGVITVKVAALDNFSFAGIIIEDNSQFCISTNKKGDVQIQILSGFYFKPFMKKYKVNYFKISKKSGEILIDYDYDNDQKVINIKKDLLK
ncbi:MAG TPA: hypothetical protein PKN32_00470 [Bacteroidales bacterium]|nr:hypothetical protein [Bacteroidales bacterium]